MAIFASARLRLRLGSNRSRSSTAFSKTSLENRRVHIAWLIERENGDKSYIALGRKASVAFTEKMRSHGTAFLAILAIRVAFEANSMDPR
jgi:hypothetical protein